MCRATVPLISGFCELTKCSRIMGCRLFVLFCGFVGSRKSSDATKNHGWLKSIVKETLMCLILQLIDLGSKCQEIRNRITQEPSKKLYGNRYVLKLPIPVFSRSVPSHLKRENPFVFSPRTRSRSSGMVVPYTSYYRMSE